MGIYKQRKGLSLSKVAEGRSLGKKPNLRKSISKRANGPSFVFYEGPPSSERSSWNTSCYGQNH